MIHLQMNGFIADNLFQYVAARIVAEDLGYALQVSHSRMHPRKNVPRLLQVMSAFADAPLSLEGKVFSQPVDNSLCMGHGDFDGYHAELAEVTAHREDRRINMAGFFQSYAMLQPYKERIRTWFSVDPSNCGYDISDDDVVVHIRMGDLVVLGWAISLRFYVDLLDALEYRTVYICGFGLGEEVKQTFARFSPVYVHGEPLDDFRFIKGFNRIILSNSGFSWWAAFLSDATEIHVPVMAPNTRTFDPKSELADLHVDDEERYHYVHDVPYMERAVTLRDIVTSLGQLRKKRVLRSLRMVFRERLLGRTPTREDS